MANLKDWIEKEANGEPIEAVIIGKRGWREEEDEDEVRFRDQPRKRLLTWEEAKPWLDYEFSSGYGSPQCNAIHAWTPSRVIFVSQYDGATGIESVPRNPSTDDPGMPGG